MEEEKPQDPGKSRTPPFVVSLFPGTIGVYEGEEVEDLGPLFWVFYWVVLISIFVVLFYYCEC